MISIASAMKQEEIITLLEAYQGENETFTFKEKNGIKLFLGWRFIFPSNGSLKR